MQVTFAKRPSEMTTLSPGENILVWFGESSFDDQDDCHNAILLAGGDLLILKTVERITHDQLQALHEDYKKWIEAFGTGQVSDAMRTALQYHTKANS